MANFLVNYWWILVALIAAVALAVIAVVRFIKTPTSEQLIKVKSWLLVIVTEAEKQFGSKTGSIKLSYCYDAFVRTWPVIAKIISFDMFSSLVDDVLTTFKQKLEGNQSLKDYISGTVTTKETETVKESEEA